MLLDGKRRTLLSATGGLARATLLSGKPNGSRIHRRVNGWTFRHYSDAMGQKRRMDILQRRYEAEVHGRLPAGRPLVLLSDLDHGLFMICEVSQEDEARNRSASS